MHVRYVQTVTFHAAKVKKVWLPWPFHSQVQDHCFLSTGFSSRYSPFAYQRSSISGGSEVKAREKSKTGECSSHKARYCIAILDWNGMIVLVLAIGSAWNEGIFPRPYAFEGRNVKIRDSNLQSRGNLPQNRTHTRNKNKTWSSEPNIIQKGGKEIKPKMKYGSEFAWSESQTFLGRWEKGKGLEEKL